jgi:hypothetical protein
MDQNLAAEAAHRFSNAADAMTDACRMLEQCGIQDEPVERLLQALEEVTHRVHRMHPPEERLQIEPADAAIAACRIAAQQAE